MCVYVPVVLKMMHIVICYYFAFVFTFHELLFMVLILMDNQNVIVRLH